MHYNFCTVFYIYIYILTFRKSISTEKTENIPTVQAKEESFLVILIPCSLEIRDSLEISTLFPCRCRQKPRGMASSSTRNPSCHPFSTHPGDATSYRKTSSSSFLLLCFICGGLRVPKSHILSHACHTRVSSMHPDTIAWQRMFVSFLQFHGDGINDALESHDLLFTPTLFYFQQQFVRNF